MAKRKSIINLPDVQKEHYQLIKLNIKVYPVCINNIWYIEVNNNGKITRYEKSVKRDEINLCVHKTILHIYEMLNSVKLIKTLA